MQIILDSDAAAELDDPNNFRAFSIVVPTHVPADELGSFVHRSGVGELDAGGRNVHVQLGVIRRLAAGRTAPDWDTGFDAMIAYARTKGWVDDAGNTVRAHLESP